MKINILISERRMEEYIDKRAKFLYYIDNNFYYYYLTRGRRNGDQKTKR